MLTAGVARRGRALRPCTASALDEVAAGAVMKHSSQWNLTRESVLGSGLAAETPGLDLQRACGTSLEAAILLGNKIALGQIDSAIAAGVDTVSDPPVVFPQRLPAAPAQELPRQEPRASASRRGSDCARSICARCCPASPSRAPGLSMGESTELMVKTWGIGRAEQDQLALESHQKAAAAYAPASTRIWCASISGSRRTTTSAPTRASRSSPSSSRCSTHSGAGHLDRGQLDADDRRRLGRAARLRGVGARAQSARARLSRLRQSGRRRLRRRRRKAC